MTVKLLYVVSIMVFAMAFMTLKSRTSEPRIKIGNDEIKELSLKMRQADENKAKPEQVQLNYQGHTNPEDASDNALASLFTKVDAALLQKPMYKQFLQLIDNFYQEVGKEEPRVSREEDVREEDTFLNSVLQSKPMQLLFDFLSEKEHPFANDTTTFKAMIRRLWFERYSRSKTALDSSGFEHVFIGEKERRKIGGLHYWVRFYTLERNTTENLDYKGFVTKIGNIMATVKFSWGNTTKKRGSMLIGTSPEFDMAIYTLCFLFRRNKNKCQVEIDGYSIDIVSYIHTQDNQVFINTVYPIGGPTPDSLRDNDTYRKVKMEQSSSAQGSVLLLNIPAVTILLTGVF